MTTDDTTNPQPQGEGSQTDETKTTDSAATTTAAGTDFSPLIQRLDALPEVLGQAIKEAFPKVDPPKTETKTDETKTGETKNETKDETKNETKADPPPGGARGWRGGKGWFGIP